MVFVGLAPGCMEDDPLYAPPEEWVGLGGIFLNDVGDDDDAGEDDLGNSRWDVEFGGGVPVEEDLQPVCEAEEVVLAEDVVVQCDDDVEDVLGEGGEICLHLHVPA